MSPEIFSEEFSGRAGVEAREGSWFWSWEQRLAQGHLVLERGRSLYCI